MTSIKYSKKTQDLKARAGDARAQAHDAQERYKESACADVAEHFAAQGISIGDKVVIVEVDGWAQTEKRSEAFYLGVIFQYGDAIPLLKKIKKDGAASSVNAHYSSYSCKLEKSDGQ